MNLQALNKANIDNLTGLWKKMGTQPNSCSSSIALNASASWPNRYWFDWDTDINQMPVIEEIISQLPKCGIVPVWGGTSKYPAFLEQALIRAGFEVAFEQKVMYLNLETYTNIKCLPTTIKRINTQQDIELWTYISSTAFAYEIDQMVIHKISKDPNIQLFLAYSEGQAAGTAMLYKTSEIIGIHQVGVVKKHQRKGIANALMQYVIEASMLWQGKYVTLQASEAGAVLYEHLGFKSQFIIRNYHQGK